MIQGIFHQGSGLGNQLHRYVATRVKAKDLGCGFAMQNPENFKGSSFMKIDMGYTDYTAYTDRFDEKKIVDQNGVDIRGYDPEFNFISQNTVIDGEFQDQRYFNHRMREIDEWLRVEPLRLSQDKCIIGFRGGEYRIFPDLFLPKEYWDEAIKKISGKGLTSEGMSFEVHTDDPETAKEFFPNYPIIHDIGLNWRSVRYAKNLIISNSSFYILPALLNQDARNIIAPRYWARHNTKTWALPQNYYPKFTYI